MYMYIYILFFCRMRHKLCYTLLFCKASNIKLLLEAEAGKAQARPAPVNGPASILPVLDTFFEPDPFFFCFLVWHTKKCQA